MFRVLTLGLMCLMMSSSVLAQEDFRFGDPLPDAPELAQRGEHQVGVQTLELVNPDQIDIVNYAEGQEPARYDRPLTVEVWYPATLTAEQQESITYEDTLGVANNPNRPLIPFAWQGRAARDAEPDSSGAPYPLVVVSHGYPGSRFMMSHLTENLASKGYVVVAIAHTESTYQDVSAFSSTLLNRALDQLFVIDAIAEMSAGSDSFLAGLVDADNTALVGYSMGGYGALNAAGAGYSETAVGLSWGVPNRLLSVRQAGTEEYLASADERIKAVVAFAPWGMQHGLWDAEGLAGLEVPTLFIAGDQDDVSNYENGIRAIYEGAVNADRYLLTFEGARHNVAPNPPPAEATNYEEYMRYADSVWDIRRVNNITQHFVTAFLGEQLKGEDYSAYLDVIENADEGVYSVADDGSFNDDHTYWQGFQERSAVGLRLEYLGAEE